MGSVQTDENRHEDGETETDSMRSSRPQNFTSCSFFSPHSFRNDFSKYHTRLRSFFFKRWPMSIHQQPTELAANGFFYNGMKLN